MLVCMVSRMCVVDLPGALDSCAGSEPQRDFFCRGVYMPCAYGDREHCALI